MPEKLDAAKKAAGVPLRLSGKSWAQIGARRELQAQSIDFAGAPVRINLRTPILLISRYKFLSDAAMHRAAWRASPFGFAMGAVTVIFSE